jgi:hypothetical protein
MQKIFTGLIFALVAFPAFAGGITYVDKIENGGGVLKVATYFDATGTRQKIGLIGISIPGNPNISIAFTAQEWHTLSDLWAEAVAANFVATFRGQTKWQTVGTFNETNTDDPSVLTMSAGQGVQLVISSPAKGSKTFVVSPETLTRVNDDLKRTQTSLNNQDSE